MPIVLESSARAGWATTTPAICSTTGGASWPRRHPAGTRGSAGSARRLRAYTDYREMLDKEALDAVYVCTPTFSHAEHAVAVAERKLALSVEKPFDASVTEAWQIARAVKRAGVISCVDYEWRYTDA